MRKTLERLRPVRTPKEAVASPTSSSAKTPWYQKSFGKEISEKDLLLITRQLSGLISASVPALEAMDVLISTAKSKTTKRILEDISRDIRNGRSFADAIGKHPKAFPAFYIAMIRAAEMSGELSKTFEVLSGYIERSMSSKRSVRAALYYPMILMGLAIVAVIVLSAVVLPKFVDFFNSLNVQLPATTRALLATAGFVQNYWLLMGLGSVLLILSASYYRRTPSGRLVFDRLLLRIPVFGETIRLINLERFAQMLSSLVDAGVPLPDSLRLTGESLTNMVYARAIEQVRSGVIAGRGLTGPLKEVGVFPIDTVQILNVGERSGRLGEQLDHAAMYYAKDVDYRLKNITSLVEPIILVFVGGIVGFVAIALVSAMYGIYSSSGLG